MRLIKIFWIKFLREAAIVVLNRKRMYSRCLGDEEFRGGDAAAVVLMTTTLMMF